MNSKTLQPDSLNKFKSANALESALTNLYSRTCDRLSQTELDIEMDNNIVNPVDKIENLATLVDYLLTKSTSQCPDCDNYEKQLQKLEADVRQHIRIQQQLKLYQDNIEEKNEQSMKDQKAILKELDTCRRKLDENKYSSSHLQDKIQKLEIQNQSLRNEIRNIRGKSSEPTKKVPLTRTIHFITNNKENVQAEGRKSTEKRPETATSTNKSVTNIAKLNMKRPEEKRSINVHSRR